MDEIIKFNGVKKFYADREVLKGINFSVKQGEIHGFLGPNGAGKSTTIKALCQLTTIDSGEIQIGGLDQKSFFTQNGDSLGLLPEIPPLYQNLTVKDYLSFVYELKKKKSIPAKVFDEIKLEFRLDDVFNRYISQLSRGNKQKIAISQAFIADPTLVILDEPAQGLDPENIVLLREILLNRSKGGCTIFLSSHLLNEIELLCHGITIIDEGEIVASGKKSDVMGLFKGRQSINVRSKTSIDDLVIDEFVDRFQMTLVENDGKNYHFQGSISDEKKGEILQFFSCVQGVYDIHWETPKLEQSYLSLRSEKRV